jgi:D-alanyl-lipoteichoic acid acyltransferase DltB (MBOAT superfamily)
MFLGGLWHGASWMFVIWGLLHGTYLVIEHGIKRAVGDTIQITSSLGTFGLGLTTFIVISVTWVFFRSPDMSTANELLHTLFVATETGSVVLAERLPLVALTLGGLVTWHWITRTTMLEQLFSRWPIWCRASVITAALLGILYSSGGDERAFIYFQF